MSRYVRLRDGLDFCKEQGIGLKQFDDWMDLPCLCCTCSVVKTLRQMDAGHFISRGLGGGSGVYFDERNVNAQHRGCNAWEQGAHTEYRKFIINKYGKKALEDLEIRHKTHIYTEMEIVGLTLFYKQKFKEMLKELFCAAF
jgi:hypothetical protein